MHFTPVNIKYLCNKYNFAPSKSYGQNFLITDVPIKKMIAAAELSKNDTVIEIGPGFGILTFALAEKAKKVIAFEIERKLQPYWDSICHSEGALATEESLKRCTNIEIIWGNALKQLSSIIYHLSSYKVVSNIPYQITSDLIRALLELENKPEMIVLMVQKEVAERICSKPDDMSLLSVAVQYYGQPEIIGIVPAGCFWPRPKVDSAILRIDLTKPLPRLPCLAGHGGQASLPYKGREQGENPLFSPPLNKGRKRGGVGDKEFFRVVKAGFSHKRKQLWSNISRQLGIDGKLVKQALSDLTGNEKIRAEELSVEQWKTLSTIIKKNC